MFRIKCTIGSFSRLFRFWRRFCYSFPCQDVSTAGLQRGLQEDSGTRSSLLWECRKAIRIKRPKYLLLENVKGLVSKKNMPFLQKWLIELEEYGYANYVKVLNAKDYGVPQNRERVFVVSVMGNEPYQFMKPFELDRRLKDVLEHNVDDRYYLSDKTIKTFLRRNEQNKAKGNGFCFKPTDGNCVASSITTNAGSRDCDNYIIEPNVLTPKRTDYGKQMRKVYESGEISESRHNMISMEPRTDGISNTITTVQKDNLPVEPKIYQLPRGYNKGNILENCPAITTSSFECNNLVIYLISNRIRKLTEREVFRLMGVADTDIDKIQSAGISKTQQYKMAGNSIVVDVLFHIFRKLFVDREPKIRQMTIFD